MAALVLTGVIAVNVMLPGGYVRAAEEPLYGTPYTSLNVYDVNVPHVLINQVYGGGLVDDSEILLSHGFIELYNPTDRDISLDGWSLQYADRGSNAKTGPTQPWEKLDLSGTIKARSSFLITGHATGASSAKVDLTGKGDLTWSRYFNNKGMKVALMSNQTLLMVANPFAAEPKPAGYVDMIGTGSNDKDSDIDGYETAYPSGSTEGTSKKKSIRRSELADTDNNKSDFVQVDYEEASGDTLLAAKPRSGADGAWGPGIAEPLTVAVSELPGGYAGSIYSAKVSAAGGVEPYTFSATGLPEGLSMAADGTIAGTPVSAVTEAAVTVTVTDSTPSTPLSAHKPLTLTIRERVGLPGTETFTDKFSVSKIGEYSAGSPNEEGGVAEIVKYNKDNGKFYLVNGSGNPPSLDIVGLGNGSGTLVKEKTVLVKPLAETDDGFEYGDLTSVDVNTETKRIAVSVQEADPMKPGKILVLDYDGNLLASYAAGIQPDMIKSTADGRYILTADEAEPRSGSEDPQGSVTIVDTVDGTSVQVLFDDPSVIEDGVHIRGQVDTADGQIKSKGTKADAVHDMEPEYITLSDDNKTAYVALQENNAIAVIDIATKKVTAVKPLGFKDYNDPRNALDLRSNSEIKLENAPFKGLYMPDGIATHTVNGQTYLLTANEGDVTEWPNRTNGKKLGKLKASLDPDSPAAAFLNGTKDYDDIEVATDMGNDSVYMYGGRSFSIWKADTMELVYDSGNDFEVITAQRLPEYFNVSNSKMKMDDRSPKKGPEPEDVKTGKVGNRVLAFVGLERTGGFMTYDVTNPAQAVFVNYTNTRVFKDNEGKLNLDTDTGPEGLEFIPADISPTGQPLLLVAYEVGGKVGIYELNATKVALDKSALSMTVGDAAVKLNAAVERAGESLEMQVTWSSSNTAVATVNADGRVTAVAAGQAVIAAVSADGYGVAEAAVTVAAGNTGGTGTPYTPPVTQTPDAATTVEQAGDTAKAVTVLPVKADSSGQAAVTVTAKQAAATVAEFGRDAEDTRRVVEFKAAIEGDARSAQIRFEPQAMEQLAAQGLAGLSLDAGEGLASITFDGQAVEAIAAEAGAGEVTFVMQEADRGSLSEAARQMIGERPVYEFTVKAGDETLHEWSGGKARISLPYSLQEGEDSNAVVIYYIGEDGKLTVVPNSVYDADAGRLYFTVNHFSTYGVAYRPAADAFRDTSASFAKEAIAYLAARGIVEGVDEGQFIPTVHVTRADFTLILARIAGVRLDAGAAAELASAASSAGFTDVAASDYYAQSVQWAYEQGIVDGVGGGKFDPLANITREQMAAMIVRFAAAVKFDLPVQAGGAAAFADEAAIDAYAQEAAAAVQQAGIVSGKAYAGQPGSYFAPKDLATREEAAKMLAKLVQLMA